MIIPPYLKTGDTIAIVSTARKITSDEIAPAKKLLEEWGFVVIEGDSIGKEDNQFAGTDADRAADLQKQMDDPDVKAILCARGGYGTVRIIDQLDFSRFKENPKWIIGYSDVTVLHNHIHKQLNIATLHATMPINFATSPIETLQSLRDAMKGKVLSYNFATSRLNRTGSAEGIIVGGNLSILYSQAGTPSDIDTKGKILFLEDLDEYLYHVDRMMMQLKRGGKLDELAGLVIGGMSDMNDNTIPYGKSAVEIITEHVAEYNYPVAFDFPAGHLKDNHALIMGASVQLDVTEESSQLKFIP